MIARKNNGKTHSNSTPAGGAPSTVAVCCGDRSRSEGRQCLDTYRAVRVGIGNTPLRQAPHAAPGEVAPVVAAVAVGRPICTGPSTAGHAALGAAQAEVCQHVLQLAAYRARARMKTLAASRAMASRVATCVTLTPHRKAPGIAAAAAYRARARAVDGLDRRQRVHPWRPTSPKLASDIGGRAAEAIIANARKVTMTNRKKAEYAKSRKIIAKYRKIIAEYRSLPRRSLPSENRNKAQRRRSRVSCLHVHE